MNNELRYSMCSKVLANLIIKNICHESHEQLLKAHEIHVIFFIYTKFPCKTHDEVDFYPKNLRL